MIILLDKLSLYSTFNVDDFDSLESSIDTISPSMTEYYLDDLASIVSNTHYLNKSNIERTLYIDSYSLHLDYNNDIYLEIAKNEEMETSSLF